jgi:hypothetical protein
MWNEMKVYSYLLSVDYGLAIKTLVLTEVKSFNSAICQLRQSTPTLTLNHTSFDKTIRLKYVQ